MKFHFALLCAALGVTSLPATGADAQGNYAIWGAGGRSCNQFARAAGDTAQMASFRDYMMGYLTAVNTLSPDTYDAVGGESLETAIGWLGEYCDEHRMDSFERALGQLVVARHAERNRMPPGAASHGWGASPAPTATP